MSRLQLATIDPHILPPFTFWRCGRSGGDRFSGELLGARERIAGRNRTPKCGVAAAAATKTAAKCRRIGRHLLPATLGHFGTFNGVGETLEK